MKNTDPQYLQHKRFILEENKRQPGFERNRRRAIRKAFADPAVQARLSEAMKKVVADPAYRARQSEAMKKVVADPAYRARQSEASKKSWATACSRSKRITALKSGAHIAASVKRFEKSWRVMSPEGVLYEFVNAARFARAHTDLIPKGHEFLFSTGLSKLRMGRASSWRGWTWAGGIVSALEGHADPLSRKGL